MSRSRLRLTPVTLTVFLRTRTKRHLTITLDGTLTFKLGLDSETRWRAKIRKWTRWNTHEVLLDSCLRLKWWNDSRWKEPDPEQLQVQIRPGSGSVLETSADVEFWVSYFLRSSDPLILLDLTEKISLYDQLFVFRRTNRKFFHQQVNLCSLSSCPGYCCRTSCPGSSCRNGTNQISVPHIF